MQEPLKAISSLLNLNEQKENKKKLNLREMREIINKAGDCINNKLEENKKLAEDLEVCAKELQSIKETYYREKNEYEQQINEKGIYVTDLEKRVQQIVSDSSQNAEELARVNKEKSRIEEQLQKQREENSKIYEKIKFDLTEKERESIAFRLDNAREEGVLIGQKQQRASREEEIKKLGDIIKDYKNKYENISGGMQEIMEENSELKGYNQKANEEIVILINTLKREQEKQRQLSGDLEALTIEIKKHKLDQA